MARQAIGAAADDQWTLIFAGMAIAILIRDYDTALAAIDHADEAIRWAERALSLNPLDQGMFSAWMAIGFAHLAAGRLPRWPQRLSLRCSDGSPC